jgi:filamentous hemagglutinin family protein
MHQFRILLLATSALLPLGLAIAVANPQGPQVVGGSATVQGQGTPTVTVTQQTNSAIINWNTFNIGAGEKTNIFQPSSSSVQLDRVTGGLGPSQILGTLWSNGRVFLVNPDGILFGAGAKVDTAGLLATTHDITNADFMAGRYNFLISGNPSASIVNLGTITAQSGGFAALVAPGVRNSGTITAKLGSIELAAGNAFTLDFYGDKLITLGVTDSIASTVNDVATGQPLSSLVSNSGKLKANGGTVELTAVAARQVVDSVINNTGVIEANSIGSKNGMIVLSATTASSKAAHSPAQTVKVSGRLSAAGKAAGTNGGTIQVTGENIAVTGATINASGVAGGGKVLIGGDVGGGNPNPAVASISQAQLQSYAVPTASTVSIDATTTINASATGSGDGGKVVVWSDGTTAFSGAITATGGALGGNGGFVETSGREQLNFAGARVDTSAANGRTGSWLLDPAFLLVDLTTDTTISAALALTDVILSTAVSGGSGPGTPVMGNGDIFVNSGISWSSANTLTLDAHRSIAVNAAITVSGPGHLALITNDGGSNGALTFASGGSASFTGTPGSGQSLSINGNSYMLLFSMNDVQGINTSANLGPGNFYALAKPLDATSYGNWTPVGGNGNSAFEGTFEGLGNTISNLAISPTANNAQSIGLFGIVGGVVQNLNLTSVNVHANPNLGTDQQTGFQDVGALAGQNIGLVNNVTASGTVNGDNASAGASIGGLIGQNGGCSNNCANPSPASIQNSSSTVTVSSTALSVQLGGLVGYNGPSSIIKLSYATGAVSATHAVALNNGIDCSQPGSNCQYVSAGGLVGYNGGTIQGNATAPALNQPCVAGQTCATGAVSVGSNSQGGGLTAQNDGIINNAFATGDVTGAAGISASHGATNLGGLSGNNNGLITNSFAAGNVGSLNVANLNVGGLVSDNEGTITNSFATGNVRAGTNSGAGGLTSDNSASDNLCSGCTQGDGFAYLNTATISNSHATGDVTVGAASIAGGLSSSGGNPASTYINTHATGAVSGGGNSILGGLIGVTDFNTTVTNSTASGAVSSTGSNSWVGGFIGGNGGAVTGSSASGPVTGTSESLLGGFVGLNLGVITNSTTAVTSTVTGPGANNYVGGFVGANFGLIDPSTAAGNVTGGVNNFAGGFAGANGSLANIAAGLIPGSTFPAGTISTDSVATGSASGGANSTVGQQVGTNSPTALPANPSVVAGCDGGALCSLLNTGFVLVSGGPTPTSTPPDQTPPPVWINPPTNTVTTPAPIFVSLTPPLNPAGSPTAGTGSYVNAAPGTPTFTPPPLPPRSVPGPNGETFSSVPPLGETRFFQNQVLLQLGLNITDTELARIAQQLGLRIITSDTLTTLGNKVIRLELPPGMSVREAILRLEANRLVSVAAPIYQFHLTQVAATSSKPTIVQYLLDKLRLGQVHTVATGKGVSVALIDSEVDMRHTELQGSISEELDTIGVSERLQPHGTEMAGAIVSHGQLLGVAPGAKILAVRAFGESNNTIQGTTLSILKGLEWAESKGARIINMSFAGPRDPSLERALKVAHDKGIVLVAAAGNAGPKSPPLYPAADPNVIAVTATDNRDRRFNGANEGPQLSIAAPGVEILAAAPDESYLLSTGTSIATAHVSGVVALMLERDPTLKPDDVRKILESTATDLGPKGKNGQFGWGLVNPSKALEVVAIRMKSNNTSTKNP